MKNIKTIGLILGYLLFINYTSEIAGSNFIQWCRDDFLENGVCTSSSLFRRSTSLLFGIFGSLFCAIEAFNACPWSNKKLQWYDADQHEFFCYENKIKAERDRINYPWLASCVIVSLLSGYVFVYRPLFAQQGHW